MVGPLGYVRSVVNCLYIPGHGRRIVDVWHVSEKIGNHTERYNSEKKMSEFPNDPGLSRPGRS